MKFTEQFDKNPLTIKDYDYHTYASDFRRMRDDLMYTGSCLSAFGSIMLLLLIVALSLEPTLLTLTGLTIGGILGLILPWIGITRSHLLGFRIGTPKHLGHYEHKFQVVIWKFQKREVSLLFTSPYFLWIIYQAIYQPVSLGSDYGNAAVILLLAAFCVFGLGMGIQSWQVYWSLGREIRRHEKRVK